MNFYLDGFSSLRYWKENNLKNKKLCKKKSKEKKLNKLKYTTCNYKFGFVVTWNKFFYSAIFFFGYAVQTCKF